MRCQQSFSIQMFSQMFASQVFADTLDIPLYTINQYAAVSQP